MLFTDLDGSLLDHETYSFTAAKPALARLRRASIPVIPATSKTAVEVVAFNRKLDNQAPFIFENGTGMAIPVDLFEQYTTDIVCDGYFLSVLGQPYDRIVTILADLRARQGFRCDGFADWSAKAVATRTGLPVEDALAAKQRNGSEPIIWQDTDEAFSEFVELLGQQQLLAVRGGRFISIQSPASKATAMAAIVELYREHWAQMPKTIAAGDSPNDFEMLKAADHAIVIPNATGDLLPLQDHNSAFFSSSSGPRGWAEGIEWLLTEVLT